MHETPLWLVTPMPAPSHLDTVEQLARALYDEEGAFGPFPCVPWDELREDERADLRHQVRSVLAVVARRMPGVLALLPPLDSLGTDRRPRTDGEDDPLLLTGS